MTSSANKLYAGSKGVRRTHQESLGSASAIAVSPLPADDQPEDCRALDASVTDRPAMLRFGRSAKPLTSTVCTLIPVSGRMPDHVAQVGWTDAKADASKAACTFRSSIGVTSIQFSGSGGQSS
jgi:hypothetical protein